MHMVSERSELVLTPVFTGNPLAQEILNLYQEPDGTRRLLNYLLDNLAGTKRGELLNSSLFLSSFIM